MRHRGTYRYIESEKGQTKTHWAREVCDRALPERSHETDETSGMGLTQEERRSKGIRSVTGVDVGNRLDARKRRGWGCVGLGMSVGVGNRLDVRKRKGWRSVRSGMHWLDARESECSGVRCWDARGVRGFGFGIGCSGVIQMTWDGRRQVGIGHIGVGMVTVVTIT